MAENSAYTVPVVLDFNGQKWTFQSSDEIQRFAKSERETWSWLAKVAAKDSTIDQVWSPINTFLSELNNFAAEYLQHQDDESKRQQLQRSLQARMDKAANQGFMLSGDPDAKFALGISRSHAPEAAGYALVLIQGKNASFQNLQAFVGGHLAMQYLKGSQDTVAAYRIALDALKEEWLTQFSNQRDNMVTQARDLSKVASDLRMQFDALVSDVEHQKQRQAITFNETLQTVQDNLAKIEHTYDEKLALQSSVSYWSKKKKSHQTAMWWLGSGAIGLALLTGSAFSWAAYELLKETFVNLPLWKLGIMVAISTFGVWLTRLTAKIFISNLHLRTDADERETMIQTYLALLREEKVLGDDDRQLILQTLFRPSATGIIKDDGPTGFYETVTSRFFERTKH